MIIPYDPSRKYFGPCYGFVDFKSYEEAARATKELQNRRLGGRELKFLRKPTAPMLHEPELGPESEPVELYKSTRVRIGNLAFETTEDDIREYFNKVTPYRTLYLLPRVDYFQC